LSRTPFMGGWRQGRFQSGRLRNELATGLLSRISTDTSKPGVLCGFPHSVLPVAGIASERYDVAVEKIEGTFHSITRVQDGHGTPSRAGTLRNI